MNNTIKEEKNRIIIKEELLDDNNLIQYEYDKKNDNVKLGVRYIENNSIKEDILTTLSIHEYASELNKRVRINEDNSTITIFEKKDNKYILKDCYDLNEHILRSSKNIKVEYNNKFPNSIIDKILVLKKKK